MFQILGQDEALISAAAGLGGQQLGQRVYVGGKAQDAVDELSMDLCVRVCAGMSMRMRACVRACACLGACVRVRLKVGVRV